MRTSSLLAQALVPATAIVIPAVLSPSVYGREYLSVDQAKSALFPGASSFEPLDITLSSDQLKAIKELSGVRQRDKHPKIWAAKRSGSLQGWFFIDEVIGKHEYITYAAAISTSSKVLGVEILIYRETHGEEIAEASWRNRFKGKSLADPFQLDRDVPNITGATLSCRNVLDGVKRLLSVHQVALKS